jgi:hypothetical protein
MNGAFYSSPIQDLVDQTPEAILGHLAKRNPFALDALQRNAWLSQIGLAQSQFAGLAGWVAFEFAIPRMGKRADVVLISAGIVFVIEFKIGSDQHEAAALDQVVDYALDLKNFHAGSHDRRIVPIVVATMADDPPVDLAWGSDGVQVRSDQTALVSVVSSSGSSARYQSNPNSTAISGRVQGTSRRPQSLRRRRRYIRGIGSKTLLGPMRARRI